MDEPMIGGKYPRSPSKPYNLGRSRDNWSVLIPILAFSFVLIIGPLLGQLSGGETGLKGIQKYAAPPPSIENRVVWPLLAASSLFLIFLRRSRLRPLFFRSTPILCLLAYLLFAGASIGWAYSQEYALQRFVKELLILAPLILPFSQFEPRTEIFPKIFVCYTLSILLNMVFVLNQNPMLVGSIEASGSLAYPGYFAFKGYLGECASIAIMMAVCELLLGRRRILSLIVIPISIWLLIESKSKGSFAITILAVAMSSSAILIHQHVKKSLALIISVVPLAYFVWSLLTQNLINKLSYFVYGNPTLTGRTLIWNFVNYEISRHPAFGWGFQSFWLVGPQAPSVVDAPGWIKDMPYTHNGYLDTELQTGYVGLIILFTFLFATLHAIGRVREHSPRRAWLMLSIALYIMLTNLLEAVWFEPDPLWVLFVLVMAESCRYNQNSRVKRPPARTTRVQLSFVK